MFCRFVLSIAQVFGFSDLTWSWVVSIFGIGGIIGGLLGGPVTAAVGPRMCMLGNNLIWIASGLCQVRLVMASDIDGRRRSCSAPCLVPEKRKRQSS
jgi:predicted MFS family arabinose efflux permease